nr:reverse transcriptase domain-containing protein [Tanacetum cinerariifolium]
MTNLRNEITRFQQRFNESFSKAWDRFNDLLRACPHHGFSELHQLDTFYNALNVNDQDSLNSAAGGNFLDKMPADCLKIIESKSKDMVRALLLDKKNQYSAQTPSSTPAPIKAIEPNCVTCGGLGTLPGTTVTNPKEDLKGITTRSGVAYQGPTIPTPSKVVKQGTEVTKDQMKTSNSQSTTPVQPTVTQSESETPVSEPVVAPVSAPMPNLKPSIPYPLRRDNERRRDQANEQIEKFYEIFKAMLQNKVNRGQRRSTVVNRAQTCRKPSNLSGNQTESKPVGIAKDVKFKVGVFHFPADFVVVDFEPDPRVPLILGRCFLKTSRALIDVHKGELTLRIGHEAITYNLDHTSRYSANYDQMTANKIDVTDEACEEYSQEVLGFPDVTASGNPTPSDDPIISTTSPKLTSFGDSNFLLFEEADAFLGLEDDLDSLELDPSYYDPEGDILLLEAILNSDRSPPLPNHEQSVPSFKEELKACEAKTTKSSIDEPPEVELKDLPPHLEYAFLEGYNKLPVIIAKSLRDEEKSAMIKVLKSHKRAIAWKLSDIQEVEKLLDAGLIYPISDSPWVSPVHCVPKKGDFTVVANKENELIPTRLVTGWRVCIDYRKLNEATRKDHFPLPFMDQMLERLARNEYYCFLDGFFGYYQIPIEPCDQEKTTFTCPYGTFTYRRMPFGLCNAPGAFQRCMLAIFCDMVEKTMEVFMDDFSVFRNFFENCLSRLDKILQRCEDTKLCLNWEKSHFMVKEGIVLDHKISKNRIEVDKAKINVIAKLPHPTTVKGAENLAADRLSRLENPYANVLDPNEINEKFPLEMLSMVTSRGDSGTPWFADFANYHAGNFLVKALDILKAWHNGPTREHHGANLTAKKVEAKALPTNDARVVCKFLKSLFARFGSPRAIISDRGSHFCNDQFEKVMRKYGVTHRLSTAYHPQTSGKVEVTNRAYKIPIGCTPYKLVYGKACHLPIELEHKAYWALKQTNFDLSVAGDHRKIQLNELNELRNHAYENSLIYKKKTKRIHDSKIKNRVFNVGDQVLLFNSRLKILSGKLKSCWSGPFTIAKVFPYGTVELSQANGPNFKVNGHRIKYYFGGDVPQLVMLKYGVTHRLSTAYHPQTSGQVEVSNRGLKRILERAIGENRASWTDKLDDALWAFRTAYKTPIRCTPYKLVYGKACHLSIKLEHKAYWALKQANFDLAVAGNHRKVQLNKLNELLDHAYENSLIYKEKTKRIHDSKIKNRVFNVGDRVLLFNSGLKIFSGKLKTHWSGPFTIAKVFPYGTVELSQANGPNFKVNGHRVKHYFGGDVPQLVVPDLQTFPMDN